MAWLKRLLDERGPTPATVVYAEGAAAGFSRDRLMRAKRRLGIRSRREGGRRGYWIWFVSEPLTRAPTIAQAMGADPVRPDEVEMPDLD